MRSSVAEENAALASVFVCIALGVSVCLRKVNKAFSSSWNHLKQCKQIRWFLISTFHWDAISLNRHLPLLLLFSFFCCWHIDRNPSINNQNIYKHGNKLLTIAMKKKEKKQPELNSIHAISDYGTFYTMIHSAFSLLRIQCLCIRMGWKQEKEEEKERMTAQIHY